MPAKTELTWEQSTHRWKKVYKGRSYTVSCKALGVPPTKLESYQAANEWWASRKAEIDSYEPAHPHAERCQALSRRLAWTIAHGETDLAESIRGQIAWLEADVDGELVPRKPAPMTSLSVPGSEAAEKLYEAMSVPSPFSERFATDVDDAIWTARLGRDEAPPGDKERTIGAQVDRYMALEQIRTDPTSSRSASSTPSDDASTPSEITSGRPTPLACIDADQLGRLVVPSGDAVHLGRIQEETPEDRQDIHRLAGGEGDEARHLPTSTRDAIGSAGVPGRSLRSPLAEVRSLIARSPWPVEVASPSHGQCRDDSDRHIRPGGPGEVFGIWAGIRRERSKTGRP